MINAGSVAIRGFYYQFLYSVNACIDLIKSNNGYKILCEGIQDIDLEKDGAKTCVQVKTSSKRISLNSEPFKKTLVSFYREYLKNKNYLFIFHTNSKPGTEIIDRAKKSTLKTWETHQKDGWKKSEKAEEVASVVKEVIKIYLQTKKEDLDLEQLNADFIMKVNIQFNSPDLHTYEEIIKEKLKKDYGSDEEYARLILVSLVHLVIKRSIAEKIEEKYIQYEDLKEIVTKTKEVLRQSSNDLTIKTEDGIEKSLSDLISTLKNIESVSEKIEDNTERILNQNLIERVDMPNNKLTEYEGYFFVKKLIDAQIPEETIFEAKDLFYQTEYASQKAEVFQDSLKRKDITRIKDAINSIYTSLYQIAKEKKESSSTLLQQVYLEIIRNNNSVLATKIGLDFFHKQGLMHHLANEKDKIIWRIT